MIGRVVAPFLALVLALVLAPGLAMTAKAASAPDRVRTTGGLVEGSGPDATGVRAFFDLPYAAAPVGPLRWRPPQAPATWQGVRPATAFGPRCLQTPFPDMVFRSAGESEDCLYLNVWTPAKARGRKLPVLLYIYGGGYIAGDGSEPRYDGRAMARRGVVVVTISHRLGVFGFFAHPALSAEAPGQGSGNQGLLDQVAALNWVRRNIEAFGGDPARVTIAGESAGSVSVSALMASPMGKDLFSGAIGESGALLGTLTPTPLAQAEAAGRAFAAAAGVTAADDAAALAILRTLPAETLRAIASRPGVFQARPVLGDAFLPRSPESVYAAGEQARVPLLAGSNTEEGSAAALLGAAAPTVAAYAEAVRRRYGDRAAEILAAYRADADGPPVLEAARALMSDSFIGLSTWRWLDISTRTGARPTFAYLFAQPRPATVADPSAPRPQGAVHSAEIEYALGNLPLNKVYAWTAQDLATSGAMQAYFANFITRGDPNGPGLPVWPRFATGQLMRLDAQPAAEPDASRARREALSRVSQP